MGFIEHIRVREVMAKKPKGKPESKVSGEEIAESEKEFYIPIPEKGGIIDFYYLVGGIGVVLSIIMMGYILLHYVLHSL
jgi:hypothetical protein